MNSNPSSPESDIVFSLRPSWRSYFVFYAAILIFGFGPIINPEAGISKSFGLVIAIFLILFVIFRHKTTFYRITKDDVRRETGFSGQVSKKTLTQGEISGIEIRRGVIHRLIGVGHLQFCSKNPAQSDLWWYGVADPFVVKDRIQRFLK